MNNILKLLLEEANKAFKEGELPIAAVVVKNNKIISKAHNRRHNNKNILDHAEIIAIKKASRKQKDWRLDDCELFVTLEPCNMCKEVIKQSRIRKTYYICNSKFQINDDNFEFLKINNIEQIEGELTNKLKLFFANKR